MPSPLLQSQTGNLGTQNGSSKYKQAGQTNLLEQMNEITDKTRTTNTGNVGLTPSLEDGVGNNLNVTV